MLCSLVQSLLRHCELDSIDDFERLYSSPSLFEELSIALPESNARGSERDSRLVRCRPNVEGSEWYDYVAVSVESDDGSQVMEYAAQVLAFIELTALGNEDSSTWPFTGMLAYVRFYVSAVEQADRVEEDQVPRRANRNDLSVVHSTNGLPYIMEDPDDETVYQIVDVSAIQNGLWVQQDFTDDERYWVLTFT